MSILAPERLVYTPKVYIYVKNIEEKIIDLTEYCTSGEVKRVINAASSAEIHLRNPNKIFTTHPVTFHPMDPITIFMERIPGYPVQVFTGYLDKTPYVQLFPGVVTLQATCTLKKLLFTYFQMGQQYTLEFFRHFGWIPQPDGTIGPVAEDKAVGKLRKELSEIEPEGQQKLPSGSLPFENAPGAKASDDGSFKKMIWALLYYIGDWQDSNIYIEEMPEEVPKLIARLWTDFEKANENDKAQLESYWTALIGTGAEGSGGGSGAAGVKTGEIKDEKKKIITIERIANQVGVPPEFVIATGLSESSLNPEEEGSEGAKGYFQWTSDSPYGKPVPGKYPENAKDLGIATANFCEAALLKGHQLTGKANKLPAKGEWRQWAIDTQGAVGSNPGEAKAYPEWSVNLKKAEELLSKWGNHVEVNKSEVEVEETQRSSTEEKGKGTNTLSMYKNPFHEIQVTPERIDMGVDFSGHGTIVALGDAIVEAATNSSPWPGGGWISYKLTKGPYKGLIVYHAEEMTILPNIAQGDHIKAGQPIAELHGGSESGWAGPGTGENALAATRNEAYPGDAGHYETAPGRSFNNLLVKLGATSGAKNPNGPWPNSEPMPPGYPPAKPGEVQSGESNTNTEGESGQIMAAASAAAFLSQVQMPTTEERAEALLLGGQKALMNAVPLMNMVQQVCESSLRSFMSLPNGNFYAFYPDYFGEFGQHEPYWKIYNIEILDGGIDLSDENLVTHAFSIGNSIWPADSPLVNEVQAGTMTIFEAFTTGGILNREVKEEKQGGDIKAYNEAVNFVKRYGARPLKLEVPMVFSTLFESLLAYQAFLRSWSRQFQTPFTFTFMPELFPGGKVAFPEHGLQMYIESVTHTWDLTSGYQTVAELTAPSVFTEEGVPIETPLPPNMVNALVEPQRGEVSQAPTAPKQQPALPRLTSGTSKGLTPSGQAH